MKNLKSIIIVLSAGVIPIALLFLGLRLLLSAGFLSIEYRMPGFPQDLYGFTQDERLQYSNIALEYLLNESDMDFLTNQTFPDGTILFNGREASHMLDVKKVVKPSLTVGYLSWFLFALLALISIAANQIPNFLQGIRYGTWILLGIIGVIGIFAVISFWNFFSFFHTLFFEGESWIFSYNDTLIRLFPLRFWQDAFLIEGLITIGGSLSILKLIKPKRD